MFTFFYLFQSAVHFMTDQIITITNKWLDSFIEIILTSSFFELLEIAILVFFLTVNFWLASYLMVYLFKLLILISKFALKLLQVIILVLLLIIIFDLIWDPNRPCRVKYEDYVTRCQPPI